MNRKDKEAQPNWELFLKYKVEVAGNVYDSAAAASAVAGAAGDRYDDDDNYCPMPHAPPGLASFESGPGQLRNPVPVLPAD